jgi:hypothetical protein
MPASSSNLSDLSNPRYGYDFVVATTQASINATMLEFLASLQEPVVNVCYVADQNGQPVPMIYEELKERAHGSDPFTIPANADPTTNPHLLNLYEARFMVGFRARLGIPRVANPSLLPDVVTLGSDTSAVLFNMLCSQFNIVQLVPAGGYSPPSWSNQSQPAGTPWVFTSKVDLRLSTVDRAAYSKLPAAVQETIKNLSATAFSVQQLLFDLTNASLETVPTISGVTPGTNLYLLLQNYFLIAYFKEMQKENQPLLGCSVTLKSVPSSTLELTDFNFEVCPYVEPSGQLAPNATDQQQLATLNYLCAANGSSLPPAVIFNWNWVDASQLNDHDGVVSINRNTFANYFRNQLASYVPVNCILPSVQVSMDGLSVDYQWRLTAGQAPTVSPQATGQTVLRFDYQANSQDEAGLNGDMGALQLQSTYSLTVEFVKNTIIITQHLVVYMYARSLATSGSGNLVDKQIVDTYTIGIDDTGRLVASLNSVPTDNSNSPSVNAALNFFTDFNTISTSVTNSVNNFSATKLNDIPLSFTQNYVFPGGKTFVFKDVSFSDFQDLVSFISYADPTGPSVVPSLRFV